jgi:hypothetical protein
MLRPTTVNERPLVKGTFLTPIDEATGASNVNVRADVPTAAPMVTVETPEVSSA